jgi:stage V sporulation protein R
MLGIEYLWGGPVKLETTEVAEESSESAYSSTYYASHGSEEDQTPKKEPQYRRVVYTMENRNLSRAVF